MARDESFLNFVIDWLSPLGTISARAMMGGHAVYADGVVFALLAGDELYLKVDGVSKPDFEREGLAAFRPFAGKPNTMSYHQAPDGFLDNREVMERWGRLALDAAVRARAGRARSNRGGRKVGYKKATPKRPATRRTGQAEGEESKRGRGGKRPRRGGGN